MSTQDVAHILTENCLKKIPKGYFRSKLFATNSVNNRLLAAASPLLSLLERLCVSPTLPDINEARKNFEHELYAFNSRLTNNRYSQEFIAIAHYLLYATIDELLGKNYLRVFNDNIKFQAFTPSSSDNLGPEKQFFNIIEHLEESPIQYLDLLELAYYCLISGFEGKYYAATNGRQALDNLIEELHQLITKNRVHKPHQLFKTKYDVQQKTKNYKLFTILSTSIIVLLITYVTSNTLLEYKAKSLLKDIAKIKIADN